MSKHTGLNLLSVPSRDADGHPCFDLMKKVDESTREYIGEIYSETDAEFIVRAVNNHYQLLEALKALYVNCEAPAKYLDMADKAIREAMKKAEAL